MSPIFIHFKGAIEKSARLFSKEERIVHLELLRDRVAQNRGLTEANGQLILEKIEDEIRQKHECSFK
jgi:hypothetical protein